MIYLSTGANGAGKTLCTLWDVRQQQLAENRPVYYNGFDMDEAVAAEFGWIKRDDPTKWMEIPEGSICIFDECQASGFGKSGARDVPKHILDLAKYRRKRGIDMWLITPHPTMLHVDVRRLIEPPSWHRHFKRSFGAGEMCSVTTYPKPELKCEDRAPDGTGQLVMRSYPKEVYKWYRSSSLHTGKRKIPRAVYVLAVAAIAVPALGWVAWSKLSNLGSADRIVPGSSSQLASGGAPAARESAREGPRELTPLEYARQRHPRFLGLPQTAPVYDAITVPVVAPFPAACIQSARMCRCYTQQGTRLDTPADLCASIVERGYFVDWQQTIAQESKGLGHAVSGDNRGPQSAE